MAGFALARTTRERPIPSASLPLNTGDSRPFRVNGINVWLFGIGALINFFAYQSFHPILLASLFFWAGLGSLFFPGLGGVHERRIFSRVFAVGFVAAGVAAVYANYWHDPGQLSSDASTFFELASGQATGLTLNDLRIIHEGALAIVLWGAVYDFFAGLGFPRERYVGISLNVTAVALTGVITLKIARQVFGSDPYRFKRLTLLFASCGLFWLFAAIHIRDAVVLLAVTGLAYVWLHFLADPGLGARLLQLVGASLVAAGFFGFLRAEFVFVPLAMAMAGVAALMLGRKTRRNQFITYVLVLIGLATAAVLIVNLGSDIQLALLSGTQGYLEHAVDQHASDSLGMRLILNQPMPIRLALGSIYLFVFPIPFWSGFQLQSAYQVFKSFNVLFFYFLIPLLGLASWELWKHRARRTPGLLFILFMSLGFTLAIAGTSLESRHFGAFLAPMLVLALLPDLRVRSARYAQRRLLFVVFSGVVVVHIMWVSLKFL